MRVPRSEKESHPREQSARVILRSGRRSSDVPANPTDGGRSPRWSCARQQQPPSLVGLDASAPSDGGRMQLSTESFPFRLTPRRNVLRVNAGSPDDAEDDPMGSESRLKRVGSSFVSYVDLGGADDEGRRAAAADAMPSLRPVLYDGEVVVSEVSHVLKFNTFSELRNGVSGVLFCTSLKLSFVTMEASAERAPRSPLCANRVLGPNDIGLLNVDALYELSAGRRKRISSPAAPGRAVEVLQVRCKDMRLFTFSFKFCQGDQGARVLQFLACHAFVPSVDMLFCPPGSTTREPPFESAAEWEAELKRCGAHGDSDTALWRVTELNAKYRLSDAMPKRFVVPRRLLDCTLEGLANYFHERRAVAWCWSHGNGAALMRGASSDTGSEAGELERLGQLSQCLGSDVHLVRLDLECPFVREIGSSFHKLQALCMPADEAEFLEQEAHFYGALEATRWLECLSGCLKVALGAARAMADKGRHVLLREQTGADLTCVVASLVQVLLDPYCRTQAGFQMLVDKEWVAGGHPFTDRLGHLGGVNGRAAEAAPVFLFFLDCVWQVARQFPSAFEFSETYLTNLWDCTHVGIYDAFLFNSNRQRRHARRTRAYRNVWDWSGPESRLSAQDLELFQNPLYLLRRSRELLNAGRPVPPPLPPSGSGDRRCASSEDEDLLSMDATVKALSVWTQCYFRWVPKAEVVNGDPGTLFLHNVRVARDIQFLAAQVRLLREHRRDGVEPVQLRHRRLPSDEYFSLAQRCSARPGATLGAEGQHLVTSSFPYAPPGPVDWGSCHVPSVAPLLDEGCEDFDD
uniref:Putative phosphatidylinositol 3-phosphate 3-phosphatase myotubularin mtm1 n=1 Tax=Ixodes ricinus TaxID=34613 RepID=V5HPT7_IXORI